MSEADEHDYVIVGAGSAGCVLANRLSEAADVLVLEAGGPDDREEIHVPLLYPTLFKSELDWDYATAPQPGLNGRRAYWPRGKTLGGSSSINSMVYVRGNPWDFDRWERLGNDGWSYDDLLPCFRRMEDFEGGASEYHGADGPLQIARPDAITDVTRALVAAAEAVGFPANDDVNAGEQEGVGPCHLTAAGEQRQSTAVAYLHPALDRDTLTAETGAQATRLLFDGDRAVGVEYEQDGERRTVRATEEVVLSAGAVESPKLLMLSGVGPADHLSDHGIDPRVDRPGVGRNLRDHLFSPVNYECTGEIDLAPTSNVEEATAFERTSPDLPAPDLQYHLLPTYLMNHGMDNPPGDGFSIVVTGLRPESRGRITLASDDPFEDPVIDPNYLDDPRDVETLVRGTRRAREIAAASPLDGFRGEEVWPGEELQSDEGIAEHIRQTVQTNYHPVGTCKMGDDALAVVDDRLRVHGVSGLRVVDASVMPRITSGNTNAPTIAIAERAAEFIRGED
jgi:choline dehydrogenase